MHLINTVDKGIEHSNKFILFQSANESVGSLYGSQMRLRTVLVPSALLTKFLRLAASNTARSIETCGILAGILVRTVVV